MREQLAEAKHRKMTPKTHLDEAQVALEKFTRESSGTKFDLRAQVVTVEVELNLKKARVERLERDIAVETENRQQ